jgi:hypothetical protein
MRDLFELSSPAEWMILAAAAVLCFLLLVSLLARSYVFCQYLKTMTGIALKPREVKRAFRREGREGVRSLFLDRIIREDLKEGPAQIPEDAERERKA